MRKKKTKYVLRADGRIHLSVTIDGKRKYFYGQTDEEVERKRDEYIASLRGPGRRSHDFQFFAEQWWAAKEPALSPSSVGNFRKAYERVTEEFNGEAVAEITPQQIYTFLSRFAARGYSARVMQVSKTALKQIFDLALIAGELNRNPINDIPAIKFKPTQNRAPASEEDLRLLEDHKLDSLVARFHYFLAYTGCRRGEAAALQWKNINEQERIAHISQSVVYAGQNPIIKPPKSASGVRDIILLDNVLEVLPPRGDPEQYVFYPDGLPKMRKMEYDLRKFQETIGLSCTCHNLRHSYASFLLSSGVDARTSMELLGHADIQTTYNIYTAVEKFHKNSAANKLNDYVKQRKNADGCTD